MVSDTSYCTLTTLLLSIIFQVLVHSNAVTLVPPSITICPNQTVVFRCTTNGIPITWSVFTPNMNYTNLDISDVNRKVMDGVIMADLISLDVSTMPITVVSTLTVNVTAELEEGIVQCLGFASNGRDTEIKSGFIHITVPPGPIASDVSDVMLGRTNIMSITISWTPLELEGVNYITSITPTIPFQTASTTSIVISNVSYNTQYNITVVASNCAGTSMDTISINYSECNRPPVAGDGVVIHNLTTTFEGSSITFTCEDGLFPDVNITATCTGGHWTTDPTTYMCTNTTGTTASFTTTTNTTDATTFPNPEKGLTVIVIIGVLIFGLVVGLAGVILVVCCCVKWQSKHHPPPSQPAPLYEEIVPFKGEVELQLRDNVAYGQVK